MHSNASEVHEVEVWPRRLATKMQTFSRPDDSNLTDSMVRKDFAHSELSSFYITRQVTFVVTHGTLRSKAVKSSEGANVNPLSGSHLVRMPASVFASLQPRNSVTITARLISSLITPCSNFIKITIIGNGFWRNALLVGCAPVASFSFGIWYDFLPCLAHSWRYQ